MDPLTCWPGRRRRHAALYALEDRSPPFLLAFAGACVLASVYGFLQGAWPFGLVEFVWSVVALRRWLRVRRGNARMTGSAVSRERERRRALPARCGNPRHEQDGVLQGGPGEMQPASHAVAAPSGANEYPKRTTARHGVRHATCFPPFPDASGRMARGPSGRAVRPSG